MLALIKTSIGTKFSSRWSDLMCSLALQAVQTVAESAESESGTIGSSVDSSMGASGPSLNIKTVDIKRYARVEKVPGGEIEDCRVLKGVMLNKDVTHPKMRRRIETPRIVLLDCPLEYKKGESQTNIEISKEEDWNRVLQIEEEQIRSMCAKIVEFKPDLVFTEKGVSGELVPQVGGAELMRYRPRPTLPPQSQHHHHPPSQEIRQQPYSPGGGSDHCQSGRGSAGRRCRHGMRRVLH